MSSLFSTAYWPNLVYMYEALRADEIVIEAQEHFVKQSLRTRCEILSANGPLRLSIPIKKTGKGTKIKDVEISYQSKWQGEHWRALCSAYSNSPFFEYFESELETFYRHKTPSLLEYNTAQLQLILKMLRVKKTISCTQVFEKESSSHMDLRFLSEAKSRANTKVHLPDPLQIPYYQTFGTKFPFVANLSILDLLFNLGKNALNYLSNKS